MALIGLFLAYAILLMGLSRRAQRQGGGVFRGGRQLSAATIFIMVTALWSSSIIVVQIDTAYASGISAVWYGVSVAVMSVLVSLMIPWFRARGYLSNSALLGSAFGVSVRRLSALVIGMTFPIFALSNALAAGAFLHVVLAWPLWLSLFLTTVVMIAYIQFAGMLSLARTQGLNFAVVVTGLVLAVWKLSPRVPVHTSTLAPAFWQWGGIGHGLIWVWFGMNILNVLAAQAEIQAVAAARDVRQAQRAVWGSTGLLLVIVAVSTWMGIQTRLIVGNPHEDGLVAFATVMAGHSAPWFVAVVGLGMWALALSWCGPLLFSGAVSLGNDVIVNNSAARWTRAALVMEGALMVAYGVWRPGEVAWWRVFGLTLRNAAVVGPTLAAFLWEDFPPRAVLTAMIAGVTAGLGLNAVTGFSPTIFWGGINPMWSAATTTVLVLAGWRLVQYRRWVMLAAAVLVDSVGTAAAIGFGGAQDSGLVGVFVLLFGLVALAMAWVSTRGGVAARPRGDQDLGVESSRA